MTNKNIYVELKSQFHRDNHVFFILTLVGAFFSGFLGLGILPVRIISDLLCEAQIHQEGHAEL